MSAAPTTPVVAGCAAVRPAIVRAVPVRRTLRQMAAGLCLAAVASAATPVPGERGIPLDEARMTQRQTTGTPPTEPGKTPADPGAPLPALPPLVEPTLQNSTGIRCNRNSFLQLRSQRR